MLFQAVEPEVSLDPLPHYKRCKAAFCHTQPRPSFASAEKEVKHPPAQAALAWIRLSVHKAHRGLFATLELVSGHHLWLRIFDGGTGGTPVVFQPFPCVSKRGKACSRRQKSYARISSSIERLTKRSQLWRSVADIDSSKAATSTRTP